METGLVNDKDGLKFALKRTFMFMKKSIAKIDN